MRLESKTLTLTLLSAAAFQLGMSGSTAGPDAAPLERHTGSDFTSAANQPTPQPATARQCECGR